MLSGGGVSLKQKLIINAGWLLAGQSIQKLVSYLIILIISRTLGDVGLGQYSFIVSFTGFVSYLSDFGINYYIMRELARNKERKELVSYALGFKIVLAVIDWFLIAFLALHLNKSLTVKMSIMLYGIGTVLGTIGALFTAVMFANEITKYESYSVLVERSLTLILGGSVLSLTHNLFMFFIVLTGDLVLLNALRMHFGRKFVWVKPSFDLSRWFKLLSKSYVFWFIYIFSFIYFNTDIIMLGLMRPDQIVGWYKAAYFFIQAAMLIPSVVINTTMPSISRLWVENRVTLKILFSKAFQLVAVLGVLGALGTFATAPLLIRVFFGDNFMNSVDTLRVLSWVIIPMFINSLYGSFMNGIGEERDYTKIIGGSALLNVFLNYTLITYMSYLGAAIATLITNWMAAVVLTVKVYNRLSEIKGEG